MWGFQLIPFLVPLVIGLACFGLLVWHDWEE